jgi:peptidoglycan pentaglycine glycine transferase (the first glycine)
VNGPESTTCFREASEAVITRGPSIEPEYDAQWDAFVAASPNGHLMQASRWGALKARCGWVVERLTLMDGDSIVAGAQIFYRSLPLNLCRLAYVPMGPMVDWENEEQVSALLEALQHTARRHGAFCLKLEPAFLGSLNGVTNLVSHGFRPSPQTVQWRSTILIDLNCSEDEILRRFNKKHRQKMHKAIREGIAVRPGTASDLPAFSKLMGETAERKEFAVYPSDYYRASYSLFASQGLGQLFLATYENTILAGIMVFTIGARAYCMFAASSNEHRELMPTYLLHWEGIRWAHAQGCVVYDFCGIPNEIGQDPDCHAHEERHDGLWGVYRFKRGFGGQVVSYPGTHDQVYSRSWYFLYNHAIDFLMNRLGETWNRKLFSG